MTDRQIDDTATRIGDRLYLHLSPADLGRYQSITAGLDAGDMEAFAVEVGHAAFTAAQRLLQQRDTVERDARNAEAAS
jgi:hypothetical protein